MLHDIVNFYINIYTILHFKHNLLKTFCPKIPGSMVNFDLINCIFQICDFLKIPKITQELNVVEQNVINKMFRK